MTAEPKTMKEWALYYADLGFAVFPLLPKTKKPAVTSGFKAATTNKELIEKWWNKNQNFNIGCATGSRSDGLVVLDFDEDEEKGKHGYDVLKDWQKKHGNLPETCQSITGRGGYHFLYKDKTATHSSKNGLYEGVDIKAEGGYIVLPPSVHPNGNIYEWEQEPEEFGITQVDAAVKHFLKGDNQQPEGEYKPPFEMPEIIPDGERVSTLVSLIASLCSNNNRRNMSIEAIKAAVRAENETRCVPALPEDELEKSVFPAIQRFLSKQQKEDERIENGWKEHQTGKAVCDGGKAKMQNEIKQLTAISAKDLKEMDIPPVTWIVNNILPVGVSMIGAPSKYYKSYMALGLCLAVCTGGKFLNFQCNKFACLYLDLESTKRRPKDRLNQIIPSGDWPSNFYLLTAEDEVSRINEGFTEQIENQLKQHPDIKLIIVDVFQMIRQPAKRNQSGYDRDYDDFKVLKKIADNNSVALLLIHHTRKMKDPNDVFNELSGSVGVMGALDSAWIITKEDRYSNEGALSITGRDMESQKFKISFNRKTFQWEYIGTEDDVNNQRRLTAYLQSPIRETVMKLVEQGSGIWEGSAEDIKNASKYLSWEIYEDVRKIGKFINNHGDLFQGIDGIDYGIKKTNKRNVYRFNSTNSIDSTNSTQIKLEIDGIVEKGGMME